MLNWERNMDIDLKGNALEAPSSERRCRSSRQYSTFKQVVLFGLFTNIYIKCANCTISFFVNLSEYIYVFLNTKISDAPKFAYL